MKNDRKLKALFKVMNEKSSTPGGVRKRTHGFRRKITVVVRKGGRR